jgi:hypothetical protein
MPASKLKRRRVARVHEPGSGPDKSDQLLRYQRALRELERDGHVSDPALAARIRAGWHPGVEMAVMTTDPELPDFIKAACFKTLLENVEMPKAAQLKLDASGAPGDTQIVIQIAPWAQGPARPVPALAPPEPVDYEEVAHGDMKTAPTLPMSEQSRLQKTINATRPTPIYEVPADPSKPKELIGEMSQAKGFLTKEQIMERLSKGPQHES